MILFIWSSKVSSSESSSGLSAADIAAAVLPPWLECASSMMIAKFRSLKSRRRSRRGMNGNFCTVEMIIFFAGLDELTEVA